MIALDYLTFTFPPTGDLEKTWVDFRNAFPELSPVIDLCESDEECIGKMLGYDYVLKYENSIFVCHGHLFGKDVVGVHVRVSGSGLPYFFSLFDCDVDHGFEVVKLLQIIDQRGCKVGRVDICFDDYDKILYPHDVNEAHVFFHSIVSTTVAHKYIEQNKGETFYLGRRDSDRMLRVYDKNAESDGEKDCIRWEIEYKNLGARAVVATLLTGQDVCFGDLLLDMLDIKTGDFSNYYDKVARKISGAGAVARGRASRLPEFQRLLDVMYTVKPLFIRQIDIKDTSLDSTITWVDTCIQALSAVALVAPEAIQLKPFEDLSPVYQKRIQRWVSLHSVFKEMEFEDFIFEE